MPEMADTTLAMDFLIRVKEGVRNTAVALTETVSPDARTLLRNQLHQGIALHQEITDLMVRKNGFILMICKSSINWINYQPTRRWTSAK